MAWVASDESFLQNLGPVDVMKLRASWGINGNQDIGDYRFVSTLDLNRRYTAGTSALLGVSPSFLPNADIGWEESEQLDIAIDLGLFNNRLTATIDYYLKNTKGLLEIRSSPAYLGVGPPTANVGSIKNTGVELSLNWREKNDLLNYSVGLNGAYNVNEVTEIGEPVQGGNWAIAGPTTRTEVGFPIAYFYGYQTDGIFQNQNEVFGNIGGDGQPMQPNAVPGDIRFKDVNNDGVFNDEDRTMIGNPTPKVTMGITGSISYKDFDLSMLWTGAFGMDVFNGMNRVDLIGTNRPKSALDRWTGEGTSTTVPRYTWLDTNNNYRISDLYLENASYLRLKNIQVGYSLPASFLDKIGSSGWNFYFSVENLLTISGYTGADPEIGAISTFDVGIDRAIYPQARTFRLGTTITF